jgi:hypothetical protein
MTSTPPTISDLLDQVSALLGRRNLTQQEVQAWWNGAANGGPNNDGEFPFTDSAGFVRLLPSPAKVQAEFLGAPIFDGRVLQSSNLIAPLVLNGVAYADTYPGIVHGALADAAARTANGAAIQSFLAWCVANNAGAKFGPYVYEYISEQTEGAYHTGLQVPFALRMFEGTVAGTTDGTQFKQFAVNYPALTLGSVLNDASKYGYSWRFGDFTAGFGVDQTGQQQAIGLLVGTACFGNMYRFGALDHNSEDYFDPWISAAFGLPDGTSGPFFSMSVSGFCKFGGAQYSCYMHLAAGTGNSFEHIYCGGGGPTNRTTCETTPVIISPATTQMWGSIQQMNIEWFDITFGGALGVGASGVVIQTLHVEGNHHKGFNPSCISGSGQLQIGTMQWTDNYVEANAGSQFYMFSVFAEPTASIHVNVLEMVLSGQSPTNGHCDMPIILAAEQYTTVPPGVQPKEPWNGRIVIDFAYADNMAGLTPGNYIWDNFGTVGELTGGSPPGPGQDGYILSWEGVDCRPIWPMPLKSAQINYTTVDNPQVWAAYGNAKLHIQGPVTADKQIQLKDFFSFDFNVPRQIGSTVTISRADTGAGDVQVVGDAVYPATPALLHTFEGGSSQANAIVCVWTGTDWNVHTYP